MTNYSRAGAILRVHDPSVRSWVERRDIPIVRELNDALHNVDGVVLAVPHLAYRALSAAALYSTWGGQVS